MKSGRHLETTYTTADLESSDPLRRSAAYNQFLKPTGVSDAWDRLNQAWLYLHQQVHLGNSDALDIVLKTAKDMVALLQGPDRPLPLTGETLENWYRLVKGHSEWPVILSNDRRGQLDQLRGFNEWPLGEDHLFKIDKGGRGRRADNAEDSPSQVGRLLVCKLEGMRKTVAEYSTKNFNDLNAACRLNDLLILVDLAKERGLGESIMESLRKERGHANDIHVKVTLSHEGYDSMPTNETWGGYYETSGEVIRLVRALPSYAKKSAAEWVRAASVFLESNPTYRDELIPQSWDEEAARQGENGKGQNAHMREKLKSAIMAQAPE